MDGKYALSITSFDSKFNSIERRTVEEEKKYLKPLHICNKALKETKGINYVFLISDAVKDDTDVSTFTGGSGWNIEYEDGGPDFLSMVGGLIEQFFSENELEYKDKLKLIRRLNDNLIKNITEGEDNNGR